MDDSPLKINKQIGLTDVPRAIVPHDCVLELRSVVLVLLVSSLGHCRRSRAVVRVLISRGVYEYGIRGYRRQVARPQPVHHTCAPPLLLTGKGSRYHETDAS